MLAHIRHQRRLGSRLSLDLEKCFVLENDLLSKLGQGGVSKFASELHNNRFVPRRHRIHDVTFHLEVILLILLVDPSDAHVEMVKVIEPQLRILLDLEEFAGTEGFGQLRIILFRVGRAVLLLQDRPSGVGGLLHNAQSKRRPCRCSWRPSKSKPTPWPCTCGSRQR